MKTLNPNHLSFYNKILLLFKLFSTLMCLLFLFFMNPMLHAQKKVKKQKQEKTDTLNMLMTKNRLSVQITFTKGSGHKDPTFAIWAENMDGKLLETLFVTQYFASGIFAHADAGEGTWEQGRGESLRPAALPYWSHKRNIISRDTLYVPTPENPVPDALSGATPKGNFVVNSSVSKDIPEQFRLLFEINQRVDWNEFWTKDKYPGNYSYKSSAQPSVIYAVDIDMSSISDSPVHMKAIGHGHYAGDNGELYNDLSTFNSALKIAQSIEVIVKPLFK